MRVTPAVIAAVCVLSLAVPALALPGGINASVTEVAVTPEHPVVGEQIDLEPTITNLASSDGDYTINAVALRSPEDERLEEYDRIRDLGTLSPGSSLQVPLSVTFDEPGTKQLRIVVYGRNDAGDRITVQYPVSVTVTAGEPKVDLDVGNPVAGVQTRATVTVANGLERDLRNVEVSLDGVPTEEARRVRSQLAAGETASFTFRIEPEAAGSGQVTADVSYDFSDSAVGSTSTTTGFSAAELNEDLSLEALARRGESTVAVTVTNNGNAPVRNVIVRGDSGSLAVGRASLSNLSAGASTTVTLPVSGLQETEGASVSVGATYEVPGRQGYTGEASGNDAVFERVSPPRPPAEIGLTGVNVEADDGKYRISGSASNLGLTEAHSVIVRVEPTNGVTPAAPNREYFVGTVPGSEFVSFDLYAELAGNPESITLSFSYLSEGERVNDQVSVPAPETEGVETPETSSGDLLFPAIGGGLIVIAVLTIIFIGWRSRRDDR